VPERLPLLPPDQLDEAQWAVYAAITGGRRADGPRLFETTGVHGELLGPFAAMVAQPAVGQPLQRLGEALRYETSLPPLTREVVILSVAAHRRSEYEWYAHAAVARDMGMSDATLESVRTRELPSELDDGTEAVWRLVALLLRQDPVDDDIYTAAQAVCGTAGVVEVVTLVGYYSLLAQLLDVFQLGLPDGCRPVF